MTTTKKLMRIFVLVMMAFCFIGCSRDSDDNSNSATTVQDGFFYSENGASTPKKSDAAWVNGAYKTIIAQNGGATVFEMNLTGLSTGTYPVGSTNAVVYVIGSGYWTASFGSVEITGNSGGKLSGKFDVQGSLSGSSVNRVSGTFTNLEIRP